MVVSMFIQAMYIIYPRPTSKLGGLQFRQDQTQQKFWAGHFVEMTDTPPAPAFFVIIS